MAEADRGRMTSDVGWCNSVESYRMAWGWDVWERHPWCCKRRVH